MRDWKLHLTCIQSMIPWFHAYDHYNYARYASLYCCQMKHLPESRPEAHAKMLQGEFAVQGLLKQLLIRHWNRRSIKKQKPRLA